MRERRCRERKRKLGHCIPRVGVHLWQWHPLILMLLWVVLLPLQLLLLPRGCDAVRVCRPYGRGFPPPTPFGGHALHLAQQRFVVALEELVPKK